LLGVNKIKFLEPLNEKWFRKFEKKTSLTVSPGVGSDEGTKKTVECGPSFPDKCKIIIIFN